MSDQITFETVVKIVMRDCTVDREDIEAFYGFNPEGMDDHEVLVRMNKVDSENPESVVESALSSIELGDTDVEQEYLLS